MMKIISRISFISAIALLITAAACGPGFATPTPPATYTPAPTYTPYPTLEPPAGYAESVARRESQDAPPDYRGQVSPIPTQAPDDEPTPLAALRDITPTPSPTFTPSPTPISKQEAAAAAEKLETDDIVRCKNWAVNNLPSQIYFEFRLLHPATMSELDRALWRETLDNYADNTEMDICRAYWSEPITESTAGKRNEFYRGHCYQTLYYGAHGTNILYGNKIYEGDTPPHVVNQFARILNWMDIPTLELAQMREPPHKLIERLDAERRVWVGDQQEYGDGYYIDNTSAPLISDNASDAQLEWYGLRKIFNQAVRPCHLYYPQLFRGRWIPEDTANLHRATPTVVPIEITETFGYDRPNRPLSIPDEYIKGE